MSTIAYWEYEPEDWSDAFTHRFISAWSVNGGKVMDEFRWLVKHPYFPDVRLTSYECLRVLGLYMPRKKGNGQSATGNQRFGDSAKMRGNEFKFANIALEPEDIADLERSESTVEFLATSLVGLASDGYGFSVKPIDKGESYVATINRPDSDDPSITYGVSSFGGSLRDTLLVALFKFDVKLEGSFDDIAAFCETSKPKSRFR